MNSNLAHAIGSIPPPETSDPTIAIISARLKKVLIDILTNGVVLHDKMTGQPAIDENGNVCRRQASAAELSVCERMVARAHAAGTLNDHAEVNKILSEMKSKGWKFPEIDDDDDLATR